MMEKIIKQETFSEVYEILLLLDNEDFEKIPKDVIQAIRENRNEDYDVDVDDILNDGIKKDTRDLLASIYLKYLATSEENKVVNELSELEKSKKYKEKMDSMPKININPNIFKTEKENNIEIEQKDLIEIKKKNVFVEFIDFIKNLFIK